MVPSGLRTAVCNIHIVCALLLLLLLLCAQSALVVFSLCVNLNITMNTFLNMTSSAPEASCSNIKEREASSKKMKSLTGQYNEDYLEFVFFWCDDALSPTPKCLICREKLLNESMVPSKLKCHLSTKHPTYINKGRDFFKRLQKENAKQSNLMQA